MCRRKNERNHKAPRHRWPVKIVRMEHRWPAAPIDVNTTESEQKRARTTHSEGLRTVFEMRIHYSLTISMNDDRKTLLRQPFRSSSNSSTTTISFSIAKSQTIWIRNDRPAVTKCNSYNFVKTTKCQTMPSCGLIHVRAPATHLTVAYRPRFVDGIHFIRRAVNVIQINSDVNVNRLHRHLNSNGNEIRRVQRPRHLHVRDSCAAVNLWPHQRSYHRYRAVAEPVRATLATTH